MLSRVYIHPANDNFKTGFERDKKAEALNKKPHGSKYLIIIYSPKSYIATILKAITLVLGPLDPWGKLGSRLM